jgi:hypothetical protein
MITNLPQSLKCAAPATATKATFRQAMLLCPQRMSVRVHAKKSKEQEASPSSSSSNFTPVGGDEPKDFWEVSKPIYTSIFKLVFAILTTE